MKQFFIKFEYTKHIHGGEIFKATDSVKIKAHTAKEAAEIFKKEHKNLEHLEIVDVHEFHKRTNEFKREMKSTAASVTHEQLIEAETLLEEEIVESALAEEELESLAMAEQAIGEGEDIDTTDYANVNVEINNIVNEAQNDIVEDEVEVEEFNTVMDEIDATPFNEVEETAAPVVEETPAPVFEEATNEVEEESTEAEAVVEESPIVEETPVIEETPVFEETKVEEVTPTAEETTPVIEELTNEVEEAVASDSLEDLLKEIIFNSGISHSVEFIDGKQMLVLRKDGNVIAKALISDSQKEKLNNLR